VRRRKARRARNPRTNERVAVPEKNVVTFQPGKEMEERVRKEAKVYEPKRKKPKPAAATAPSANANANATANAKPKPPAPGAKTQAAPEGAKPQPRPSPAATPRADPRRTAGGRAGDCGCPGRGARAGSREHGRVAIVAASAPLAATIRAAPAQPVRRPSRRRRSRSSLASRGWFISTAPARPATRRRDPGTLPGGLASRSVA